MSLNKFNIKSLIIIASLILLVRVNVYSTVYTTISDGNWNSSSIWSPSKPHLTWGFNDTIYVANDVNLNSSASLYGLVVVQSGASLTNNNKSINVKEYATFINNGTVEIKNLTLDWGINEVKNNSSIVLHGYFNNNEGTFTNSGTMTTSSYFKNSWDAYTINNGTITVGGYFKNSNDYTGNGNLVVAGNFINDWTCSFSSTGDIQVTGNFTNRGSAELDNSVNIGGNFINDYSSTLSTSDTVLVIGNFTNRGPFTNNGYIGVEDFTNQDTFTSTGTTKVNGKVVNKSDITNSGTFDVTGNFTNKWSNNDVVNSGNFIVGGNMTNNGTVTNSGLAYVIGNLNNSNQIDNDGNFFVDSSVSGSGDIDGNGTLCNSDGQTDPTSGSKSNNVTCTVCDGTTNTLPVKLVSFEVQLIEANQVNIEWTTATEENNDYFEVLHSTNGIDFEVIATVNGAGNSNVMQYYQAIDYNASEGVNYYQLKQVDYDGKSTLSNIQTVRVDANNMITLYPNPANIGQQINVQFQEVLNYQVEVYDISGRLVLNFSGADSQLQFSTESLSKGNYILRLIDGEQVQVKRFIVQ
jgi:hypothetical protein